MAPEPLWGECGLVVAPIECVLVDVFTDRPLEGNQLAVFPAGDSIPEHLLQPIARELNLAETVFVYPPSRGGDVRIRLFSTVGEIPFAGHPILGTACVVARQVAPDARPIMVETAKGMTPVEVDESHGVYTAWMDQPVPRVVPWRRADDLLRVLNVDQVKLPVCMYDNGAVHVYVMLPDPADVAAIVPDFPALGRVVDPGRTNLVGVNCFAGADGSYTTRVFFPYDLVPEDAGCGSAAGPLGVHLLRHDEIKPGQEIVISQGAQVGRRSTLRTIVDGAIDRLDSVRVGGDVRLVGSGTLTI